MRAEQVKKEVEKAPVYSCLVCRSTTTVLYGRVQGGIVCCRKCSDAWTSTYRFGENRAQKKEGD